MVPEVSVFRVVVKVASMFAVPVKSKRFVHVPSDAVRHDQTRKRILAVAVFDAVIVVSNRQVPLWIVTPPKSVG